MEQCNMGAPSTFNSYPKQAWQLKDFYKNKM